MAEALKTTFRFDEATRAYVDSLRKRWSKSELRETVREVMDREAKRIARQIARTYLAGQRLGRRTGELARAMAGEGVVYRGVPEMRVGIFRGPALRYAAAQEYGTQSRNRASPVKIIRPKEGRRALAVPTGPAVTSKGVPRYRSPRRYPGKLTFIPARQGRRAAKVGWLFDVKRKVVAYTLMRRIDLDPRFFLRDGVNQMLPETITRIVAAVERTAR